MNQQERIDDFIAKYQKLCPDKIITNETKIKGQSIDRICQFNTEKPYGRLIRWLDNKVAKLELENIQKDSPNLFDKPVKEKKSKKKKVVDVPKTSLGEVLIAFKLEKLTLEDTVYIIRKHYEK